MKYLRAFLFVSDGVQWVRRTSAVDESALADDAGLQLRRYALYRRHPRTANLTMHVHTTQVSRKLFIENWLLVFKC